MPRYNPAHTYSPDMCVIHISDAVLRRAIGMTLHEVHEIDDSVIMTSNQYHMVLELVAEMDRNRAIIAGDEQAREDARRAHARNLAMPIPARDWSAMVSPPPRRRISPEEYGWADGITEVDYAGIEERLHAFLARPRGRKPIERLWVVEPLPLPG